MIQVLVEREFPVGELRLLASGRSAGRTISIDGRDARRSARPRPTRSTASTSRCSRPAPTSRASWPRRPPPAARRSSTTRPRGGWTRPSRSSCRQVNPDDARGPRRASSPTRTARRCSSRRCSWPCATRSASSGSSSTPTSPSRAPAADAIAELEAQIRAHVAGEPTDAAVYPHPIAFNALPEIDVFLDERLHQGGVEGRHREPQDPAPAGPADLAARPSGSRSSSATPRRSTSRRATRSRPERARELFAAVPGRRRPGRPGRRTTTRSRPRPPAATRSSSGRVRQDPSIAGRPRPRLLGRLATTCARAPRRTRSRSPSCSPSAAGSGRAAERRRRRRSSRGRGRPRPRRDRRRAPGGARGDRRRGPRLHALPPPRRRARTPCPGEGNPDTEVVFVGEGPGFNEDRRAARSSAGPATCSSSSSASIGWQREDVFITNVVKCRPPDNRDPEPDEIAACAPYLQRQLEVLDPAARRDPRPLLDGHVHARRPDLGRPTARSRPVDPATGAARRPGVRDVPPGRRAPDAGDRARRATTTSPGSRRPCSTPARRRERRAEPHATPTARRAGASSRPDRRSSRADHRPTEPTPSPPTPRHRTDAGRPDADPTTS